MNRWKIPPALEKDVLARDTACIYCGIQFAPAGPTQGAKASWEHIVNDAQIIARENITRCCRSCNASKGARNLRDWLASDYCGRKAISETTVAQVVRDILSADPYGNGPGVVASALLERPR